MPGLDPGIHDTLQRLVDCRVKPGNDGLEMAPVRVQSI